MVYNGYYVSDVQYTPNGTVTNPHHITCSVYLRAQQDLQIVEEKEITSSPGLAVLMIAPLTVAKSSWVSMGIKKDPIDGGTLVPYFWPYFLGIFPYIGLKK